MSYGVGGEGDSSEPPSWVYEEEDQPKVEGTLAPPSESQGLLNSKADKVKADLVFANFVVYICCFSTCHGALISALSYAKTELGDDWGAILLGIVYFSFALSSLFASQYVTNIFYSKHATMLSLLSIAIFQLCFWGAVEDETSKPYLVPLGSIVGGIGWGLAFTASGVYYKITCEEYGKALNISEVEAENNLAGVFSTIYTLLESILKLVAVCFIYLVSSGGKGVFLVYAIISFTALLVISFVISYADKEAEKVRGEFLTEVFESVKFGATNVKMMLISPYQMMYGFTVAFFLYYIDGSLTPNTLSSLDIGLFGALETFVAALVSPPYAWAANRVGRIWVMLWCHVCFLLIYSCFLGVSTSSLSTVGMILLLYIIQGAGRAVFESINKAVIVTYFPSKAETAAAFANSYFWVGLTAAFGVTVFDHFEDQGAAILGLILLGASVIGQVTASTIHFYHKPDPALT